MIYLLAVIAAIVAAVVGWFVTGAVTVWIAGLYGMSDFEGGRGMFAFLGVGPIGGLISMVTAAWLVLRTGEPRRPIGGTVARVAAVLVAIALLTAGAIWLRLATLDTYTDSAPPTLELEMRLPLAVAAPEPSDLQVQVHTQKNVGEGWVADHWAEDGTHRTIAGGVSLDFKTAWRLLVVKIPGQPDRLFRLPLSRDPRSTSTYSDWQRAGQVGAPGEAAARSAPADDPLEMRYRVSRPGDE